MLRGEKDDAGLPAKTLETKAGRPPASVFTTDEITSKSTTDSYNAQRFCPSGRLYTQSEMSTTTTR